MDKRMKGKVIKEKSGDEMTRKGFKKTFQKKVQNKKDIFHTQNDLKNHKRREKEEKKKQKEKKNIYLQFVGKTYVFLDTSKQESKTG